MNYIAESKPIYELTKKVRGAKDIAYELKELEKLTKEHFVAVYLDANNRLVHKETITIGTLNQSLVHPREVFLPAFKRDGVASVIVAHNHPSGNLSVSSEDIQVTRRLVKVERYWE